MDATINSTDPSELFLVEGDPKEHFVVETEEINPKEHSKTEHYAFGN